MADGVGRQFVSDEDKVGQALLSKAEIGPVRRDGRA